MTIAILAHDSRKELALQFCTAYSAILSKNTVIATGTTGRMLAQTTGLPVHCYLSGRLGGVQQITSRIACDEVDLVLFFRIPATPTSRICSACAICTASPLPPTLPPPRSCCAVWIRATWTTAKGCIPLLWSRCPPCSATPCDGSCIEYWERDSAAGDFLRRCCFCFAFISVKPAAFPADGWLRPAHRCRGQNASGSGGSPAPGRSWSPAQRPRPLPGSSTHRTADPSSP